MSEKQDDLRGNSVAALSLRQNERKKRIIKGTKKKKGTEFTANPEIEDDNFTTNH